MTPTRSLATGADSDDEVARIIETGARQLGVLLDAEQTAKLVAYLRLIARWNATYNLTSVKGLREMATQHIVDCLAVLPSMRSRIQHLTGPRILDVGSGAGLPGVVIAVTQPGAQILCVDSVGKKTAFITQVAGQLGLKGLEAWHGRIENRLPPPQFDLIVSRAFASLPDFISSSRHLLARQGAWMAMKGKMPTEELADEAWLKVKFHVEQLQLPGLDANRCLIWANDLDDSER